MTSTPTRPFHFLRRIGTVLVATLLVALIAACGGGVDSGGTGAPASAFASGPITGFGSVIVTGVHFDERNADIRDADGNARSASDLQLGMTVAARGGGIFTDADGNDASTATSIVYASAVVGPVTASDLAGRTLTVLGQTIELSSTTVFDDALAGGQAALAVGNVVEVYADLDVASGRYRATRVERRSAGVAAFAIRGIVSNLDPAARSFSIGPTRVSFAGLSGAAVPASLANGQFLRVSLALAPGSGGVWPALRIGDGAPATDDRDEAKLEGLVTGFASSTRFSVQGTPVDAGSAQFPDGTAGLANGQKVEVEGAVRGGVLIATKVRIQSQGSGGGQQFQVRGAVQSVDPAAQTFVIRNVIVSYAGAVDFRKGTAADLLVGRDVEARGALSADGTRLQAVRIDFKN